MQYRHNNKFYNTSLPTDAEILDKYFNKSDVCCWTSDQVEDWMVRIGQAVNEPIAF